VYMTRLQSMAQAGRKSFEYNYVNPPRADGSSQIWEYAGDYMAAHAGAVNNPRWISVLFAIGVDNHPSYSSYDPTRPTVWQPVSDAQVESFHWLVARLVAAGAVKPGPDIREHRHLAGAATTCPGDGVRARWSELVDWRPPTPDNPGDPTMVSYFRFSDFPCPCFASSDGATAHYVGPVEFAARGVKLADVALLPRSAADRYTFVGGAPLSALIGVAEGDR
jgi:hypothetical protein